MIGLLDANNFFVSCERLFRPDLVGKPVAVLSSNDGVIVARSNELKAMGVPMGMPLFQAKQLVDMSTVTLFSSNFTLYRDISSRLMQILASEVGECEVYSVDEAFFQVGQNVDVDDLIKLRQRIIQQIGIPVSVGVAKTKTLAKVGSELAKKNERYKAGGVCLLTDDEWCERSTEYSCVDVWNLGRASVKKLNDMGVATADDFMRLDRAVVQDKFGIGGRRVQEELSGQVVHKFKQNSRDLQKSIMSTRSFAKATTSRSEVESALSYHLTEVANKLRSKGLLCSRLHVIARAGRHSDFALRTGSIEIPLDIPTNETVILLKQVLAGFEKIFDSEVPYKKAGVIAVGLSPVSMQQLDLFQASKEADSQVSDTVLDDVVDSLNRRFGRGALRSAITLSSGPKTSAKLRSSEYTTKWKDIPSVQAK